MTTDTETPRTLAKLGDERLAQLDDSYFHLRMTGVSPNVEWDDFKEREAAYHEVIESRRSLHECVELLDDFVRFADGETPPMTYGNALDKVRALLARIKGTP